MPGVPVASAAVVVADEETIELAFEWNAPVDEILFVVVEDDSDTSVVISAVNVDELVDDVPVKLKPVVKAGEGFV